MIKIKNRNWIVTVMACGLMTAACSKSDKGAEGSVLRFVPASTPYVIANTTPLPDALYDKFEPKMDRLLVAYQTVIREAMKSHLEAIPEEAEDKEETQRLAALADELSSLLSISGIREAGIGRDSTFAFYGNGLLPVLRIQLSDGAAFDAAIAQIEERAGKPLQTAKLQGKTYRYVDADEARVIIGVFENQAVITVAPTSFADDQLSELLGFTLPKQSIAASGELQNIAAEYGFTDHYLGFLSMERIAGTFVDSPSGLDAELLGLVGDEQPELSDVCKAEIRSMVGIMPRMVLGYTRIDTNDIDSSAIIELRPDIALGLSMLPAAIPGLGSDNGGLMSFGFGLKPLAVREFVAARLDAMEADPFECEFFQELQQGVAAGREALNQPVPPIAYNFRGFLAVIDELEGHDFGKGMPPTSVSARLLVAMEGVEALVAMGALISPELAQLNLQPDGKTVPLELTQMDGHVENPHVAMTENALVISVGEGTETKIAAMLEAELSEQPPLISVVVDTQRYYAFVGDAIAASDDEDGAPSPEMQAAIRDVMTALSEMYGRMQMDVMLTSRGVEIEGQVSLAD